jgi:prepilin signal peptidase PulO-like enzyme (type II secretory pathway)
MIHSTLLWRASIVCASLAGMALVTFNLIGSTIDAQGVLHEPFFLIPVFWLLVLLSLVLAFVALVKKARS